MARPFAFLRHGVGVSNDFSLWVSLRDPTQSLAALTERLKAAPFSFQVISEAGVLHAKTKGFKNRFAESTPEAVHAQLDGLLLETHGSTPISLVVRDNKVTTSQWHRETIASAQTLLDVLDHLIAPETPYGAKKIDLWLSGKAGASIVALALESVLKQSPLAAMVNATLRLWADSVKAAGRAVINDHLSERIPGWLGRRYDVDVVLRDCLAAALQRSAQAIEMPASFLDCEAQAMARTLEHAHQSRTARADRLKTGPSFIDWASLRAVKQAIAEHKGSLLETQFRDSDLGHQETALGLTSAERRQLNTAGAFSTLLANAATAFMMRSRFADALTLYDDAIEGDLHPQACGNPLFAIQDDNNHLGVNEPRARRYLERCLPHGRANPLVYLNASGVFMEINEPPKALEMLTLAKAAGVAIKTYKNDRAYIALRELPEFKKLMK